MKQYVSVFILMLQSIRNKLLPILGAVIAADCIMFTLTARKYLWMEDIIWKGRISLIFCAALFALSYVLSTSMAGNSRQSYTLQRLALPGRTVFCIQTLVNLTALLLLWAVQLMTILLLFKIYLTRQLASADHSLDFCEQSVFLVFYRSRFLRNLFPMESIIRWMGNLSLFVLLAVFSAKAACRQQSSRKIQIEPLLIAAIIGMGSLNEIEIGYSDLSLPVFSAAWILMIWRTLSKDGPYMDQDSTINTGYKKQEDPAATPEELEVMK